MSHPETPNSKRPTSIAIICILNFIFIPIALYFLAYCMEQSCPELILPLPLLFFWSIAMLIISIGLWNMKKWAAYSYIFSQVSSEVIEWGAGERSTQDRIVILVQVLVAYFILKNVSKMT